MKGAKLIFSLLEALFIAVVPVALVIYQYGYVQPTSAAFKLSLTGIILIALVFYGVKKVVLDRKLRNWEAQYNNYVSAYKIETDMAKKERAKQEMQKYQTCIVLIRAFIPMLIFIMIQVLAKALEAEMITLSGLAGLITASFAVGIVFAVLAAREV